MVQPDVPQVKGVFDKTTLCRFFLQRRCVRGAACKFAHGHIEQRAKPDLQRTKLCPKMQNGEHCGYSNCGYAHKQAERRKLQLPAPVRMTRRNCTAVGTSSAPASIPSLEVVAGATAEGNTHLGQRGQTGLDRSQKQEVASWVGAASEPLRALRTALGDGIIDALSDANAVSMSHSDWQSESKAENALGFETGGSEDACRLASGVEELDDGDVVTWVLVEEKTFLTFRGAASASARSKSEPIHSTKRSSVACV